MISIFSIPPLISSLAFLFLGIFVFANNSKSRTNIVFFLNCLVTFWWQFSWFILFNVSNSSLASILVKIGYSGIIFIPITFWHFFVSLFHDNKNNKSIFYSYLIGLIFVIFLWSSNILINGYYSYYFGYYPRANFLHILYLCFLSYLVIKCFFLLFSTLNNICLKRSIQVKYLIISFILYVFAASDFLVNYGLQFYPLGYIAILLSLSIVTYAITKHHLMDIEIVIKKTAVYSILTAILTGLFIAFILIGQQIFSNLLGQYSLWVAIIAAFVVAIIFQPLKDRIQSIIDKLFFKEKYDYRSMMKDLGEQYCNTKNKQKIIDITCQKLKDNLKIENAEIYLVQREFTKRPWTMDH